MSLVRGSVRSNFPKSFRIIEKMHGSVTVSVKETRPSGVYIGRGRRVKRARFGSTYTKIGTIQRRLAWPLRKDDTQIREAFHILRHSPPPDTICRSNTKNCEVLRGSFGGRRPVCAFRRASPKPEDTWNSLSPDPLSSQRRF